MNEQEHIDRVAAEVIPDAKDASAICVIIVRADGSLRTMYAFRDGGKLPMIAGLSLITQDICASERKMTQPPMTGVVQ